MRGQWLLGLCAGVILASVTSNARGQSATDLAPIAVVDQRPASDLKSSWLSLMITSCEYGIRRIADEPGSPSRTVGLQADLQDALGSALAGRSVTVTRYGAYFNAGALNRKRTYTVNTGVIAGVMEGMGSKCSREDTKAGWYQASEVTNTNSPIIVELAASVDGKTYDTRSVYSPDTELNPFFSKDANAPAALAAALKKANAGLIAQIGADVAPVAAAPAPVAETGPTATP